MRAKLKRGHPIPKELSDEIRNVLNVAINSGALTVSALASMTGMATGSISMFCHGKPDKDSGRPRGVSLYTGTLIVLAIKSLPNAPDLGSLLGRLHGIAAVVGEAPIAQLPPAQRALALPPARPAAGSFPGAPPVPKKHRARRQDLIELRSRVRAILKDDGDRLPLAARLGSNVKTVERILAGGTFTPKEAARLLARLENAPPHANGAALDVVRELAATPAGPSSSLVARASELYERMRREAFEYVMRAAKAAATEPKR